jgi:signal transduction histidine kinase
MNTRRSRRLHAARVATVATVVVMTCYLIAVLSLNLLVARRLTEQADARIAARLSGLIVASPATLHAQPIHAGGDSDPDDAPILLWSSTGSGGSTAISGDAPRLPRHVWTTAPTTVVVNDTAFRVQAVRSRTGWLIGGESLAQLARVRSALLAPEILFGLALLLVVYGGSLVVGLRASAPLEIVQRRQAEFTADASHELRTPLSVIEAEVELTLSRERSPEEYRAVLGRIAGEGHRLRHIVDELLWLARADDEGTDAHREQRTDVAAVASICGERFQPVATARQVILLVDAEGANPYWIEANPSWIDRLLGVLVDNACKYAGDGGYVRVTVRGNATRVVLQVDDTGPGIPLDQRAVVFDRFHRGTNEPGGVGLGLAIADSVVRASGGTWSVKSSPSGGTRMEVSWRRVSGRRVGAESPQPAIAGPDAVGRNPSPDRPPPTPGPDGSSDQVGSPARDRGR